MRAIDFARTGLTTAIAVAAMVCAAAGDCGEDDSMEFTITSEVFEHEGKIPRRYTCEGDDVSPPLAWSREPEDTQSLVLIVDDPDVPDPKNPRRTWVHWVLYDIPPAVGGLSEDVSPLDLPPGTHEGLNDWERTGYGGPCPPIGRHRYFHKLYALDTELGNLGHATKDDVERAMKGHILAEAVLMGTYQKGD
jgi:Raf kinase inhibitor-like YbhB/YbcL family protein